MRKPGIPPIPRAGEDRVRFDGAVKESLETLKGDRGGKINPLNTAATAEQIALKVNEILALLQ